MAPDLDQTLAALSDPTRRRVIELLSEEPYQPSELADALEITRPAISRHLRVLRRCGLVEEQISGEDARVRFYRLRRDAFSDLRDWIDEVEAFWGDQLASFKAHAERRHRSRKK